MKPFNAWVAAIIAAAAWCAMPAQAITGKSWVEDFEHPFVGLIVFYDTNGEFVWRCSGSLIAPLVFLTAGHCTDPNGDAGPGTGAYTARIYFQQDAGANYDPVTQVDPVTGYPETCAPGTEGVTCVTASAGQLYNYGFADFAGFPNHKDVGLVILDEAPSAVTEFGVLPTAGLLGELAGARSKKSPAFTVSGYGLTLSTNANSPLPNISFRERLMAQATLVNLISANTDGFNLQTQGNGKDRGGTCGGDSGGPVFLGGPASNLIVAVTSFGLNELCRGTDFAYRIDQPDVLAWIRSIAATYGITL